MDILSTTEDDNSLTAADEKVSPFNTSYSTASCLRAFMKGKMKQKKIIFVISKHYFKALNT